MEAYENRRSSPELVAAERQIPISSSSLRSGDGVRPPRAAWQL